MHINSSMLRLTWSVIENTPSNDLLALTDTGLIKVILQQITNKILLNGEEVCALYGYIASRTALIRDIAESRVLATSSM
ncbi:hypothetical protein ACF3DV_03000 [Chlorogloeopsis fritschii PCC 9212]|jgi:hypothetical protein|uniref:Uncharacterized protein n=1 Tax=Chlorogloeopsis fritschii PCC 6912 TaxID=211165 RepID=A0A433N1D5_CHLFR|nr:hypothetical protein [Chlorogloeopsis fritschii]RUR74823.1 hypothetical protein PCC6912_50010 [Chlorogloeopsis fritschii PCC 6912]